MVELCATDVANSPRYLSSEKKKLTKLPHLCKKKKLLKIDIFLFTCIAFYRFYMYCSQEIYNKFISTLDTWYFMDSKTGFSHFNISEVSVFNNPWHSSINFFFGKACCEWWDLRFHEWWYVNALIKDTKKRMGWDWGGESRDLTSSVSSYLNFNNEIVFISV